MMPEIYFLIYFDIPIFQSLSGLKSILFNSLFLISFFIRSTKDTSSFTVVLNNLRVFLIFDWLLLVHDFLQMPSEAKKEPLLTTPSRQRSHSSDTAVVPKAVKCGIVTKRSSLQVTTEKQLEVKINVTGMEEFKGRN